MKRILLSKVINKVKEKLHVYFENDTIDDAILYNKFDNLKSNFRLNNYTVIPDLLFVENYKVDLPKDFYKAITVLGCFEYEEVGEYTGTWTIDETKVEEFNICESTCNVCTDECGNLINIVQKFDRLPPKVFTKFDVLSLTKQSKDFCSELCINNKSTSQNQIQISDNQIFTEFASGFIYIEYFKSFDVGSDCEIPYHPRVNQWLESEFICEIFETMYLNGETDIQQRYQIAKQNANRDYISAKSILRTPEFTELYDLSRALTDRYNRLRLNIYDNEVHGITYYSYRPDSHKYFNNINWNG